jgi:YbgC/YbaW family acyl-CoA thioester hydrolase
MSRIKIQLPEGFNFSTTIPIRITDLNYGGHVGNDKVLSIIHEARMQFLKSFGYTEMKFENVSLIMSDVAIEFKSELFYGDVITAFVAAINFTRSGFDIYYKLMKENTIAAIAETGMVCFDYEKRKVVSVPQKAVERMCTLANVLLC